MSALFSVLAPMFSTRQQYAIQVALFLGLNRRAQVRRLIARAHRHEHIPRLFFEELFIHLSLLYGFPTLLDGLESLSSVYGKRRAVSNRGSRNLTREGRRMLRLVYGLQADRLLENLRSLHPELPGWIVRDVYGKVFARRGLTIQERELANVVALGLQGLQRQLYSHIRGSLRVGIARRDIVALLRRIERQAHHPRGSLVSLVHENGVR